MPNVDRQFQQINMQRAIVIALGGTGAEVITRLRKLIIDHYGGLDKLPIVEFLYIDTDPNWIRRITAADAESEPLSAAQIVDAQVHDASDLYAGIEQKNFPNYDWFTLERLKGFRNINDGAGTVRQLGRLCFWQHQTDIERKFNQLVNKIRPDANATYMRTQHGQIVDPGINVHIIAGLAGGTGSGCFLDMAYLARHLISQMNLQGAHQYISYLVMPGAFATLPGTNALPNGYAALKELNYLNYRHARGNALASLFGEPQWDVSYTADHNNAVEFTNQMPFDFTYLIDSSNAHVQLNRDDIFGMISRSIYHEFSSEFASFKRSLRANIRNRLTSNDTLDCPTYFMSLGLSAVYLPTREITHLLKHQLALRAVQQWIDKTTEPIKVLEAIGGESQDIASQSMASLKAASQSTEIKGSVAGYINSEFLPGNGLQAKDVLAAVVASDQTRLTDVPTTLKEEVKERWINEKWPREAYKGRLTAAWDHWNNDFNDTGADPGMWGPQIRWMIGNQQKALRIYRTKLYTQAMHMFHDQHRGPAYALCFLDVMRSPLLALQKRFIEEANNAVLIANELGDVHIINAASQSGGPSLSAIIEERIGQELQELDNIVNESGIKYGLFHGEERLRGQAEEYLKWCAHWCRARVEERSRRLAAEMCGVLASSLDEYKRQVNDIASALARLQAGAAQQARQWAQAAATIENVGTLLFDPIIVDDFERKIIETRGDAYNPELVAAKALEKLGTTLDKLKESEVEQLLQTLLEVAGEAIGDLEETGVTNTEFAAHDLLSAQCLDDDQKLRDELAATVAKSTPFIQLSAPSTGYWAPGGAFPAGLLETRGAGIRGGYEANDQDVERVRVITALSGLGWVPGNDIKPIRDSEQIVFAQECGGFPLRALAGVRTMKQAYDNHRKNRQSNPLHIVNDEMAEIFPDLIPPGVNELQRALTLQSVGMAMGDIGLRKFPQESGTEVERFAYCRLIPETGEEDPVELGESTATVVLNLAYNGVIAQEIEAAIQKRIKDADLEERQQIASHLTSHLALLRDKVISEGRTPAADLEYTEERDRIIAFMRANQVSTG
jgi:hypothetical protein